MKKLQNLGKSLSKIEQKKIMGGVLNTPCVGDGVECHRVGTTIYTCSSYMTSNEEWKCCCGHSAYNNVCYGF